MDTTQVLKGVLDTAVLGALRQRPTYGYDLVRRLRELGLAEVAEASVYGTLRRLNSSGLLAFEIVDSEQGPPRKYYSLNDEGRAELTRSAKTWGDITATMERILKVAEEPDA
jgi:PadR family transcriptional regulator, regulatory protein PadR